MRLLTLCFLILPSTVLAQGGAKVPDPDPELERKSFILPEGFEVNLFAADPLLAKPIQMNFDARGRLWIVSSETYPQIKPGEKADDKIIILEDTKGEGKADKVTVFADGLLIPTGLEPGDGGVYVANSEGINYVVPGGYYATAAGASRIIQGLNLGSPKHCGLEILSGRHLPEEWRGNMITNDFRGHRVCRFVLKEDGSAYLSQEKGELIKTNHEAFRPIDVKMGPDGAIYIADWYNPIIQHGEVDFRDPRRDHVHGRIWRVTAKGRPLVPRPKLVGAPVADLLDALKAPEGYTRHSAKRVLKERSSAAVL